MADKNNKQKKRVEPMDKTIGARLRAQRTIQGLTQEQLANKLGITFQQVQKYERGVNRVSVSRLVHIARALNTPIDFFVNDPDIKGFAEGKQDAFEHQEPTEEEPEDIFKKKETLKLLKVYYSIEDPQQRKDLMKVIKTFAKNIHG